MGKDVPDKNVEVDGKVIGANSVLRLSVKTALWLMAGIFAIVMGILSYSYFDLKADVKADGEAKDKAQKEFIERVDAKLEKMDDDVEIIRLDQRDIKGDIKLILDRQTRDNPVRSTNVSAQPIAPPPTNPAPDTTNHE